MLTNVWRKNKFLRKFIDAERLAAFNKILAWAALALALLLAADVIFVSPKRDWLKNKKAGHAPSAIAKPDAGSVVSREPLDAYLNGMAGKQVFAAAAAQTKSVVESSLNNLSLVGIIPGEKPQAILEDKKSQVTYYLVESQSVNGITVEDIQENKVVVSYEGETVTLSL